MEEKYNQIEDENASDTSDKSKTGVATPEKKILIEPQKIEVPAPVPTTQSTPNVEPKDEEDQDSDHEDPHGSLSLILYMKKN